MRAITDSERLARLRQELNYAGHCAYSRDNMETEAAAKAFERVDKIKEQIKVLEKKVAEIPLTPAQVLEFFPDADQIFWEPYDDELDGDAARWVPED